MIQRKKFFLLFVLTVILSLIFGFMSFSSFALEVKPGDVINSENIDQFQDYFPPFMQRFIKDGWGFETPVVVKVKAPEPIPFSNAFMTASKKNMATAKLTSEGLIEGFDGLGLPFLELKEPNLATKIMWNQYYKEIPDDWHFPKGYSYLSLMKRGGGRVVIGISSYDQVKFSSRMFIPPCPELQNPNGLFYATLGNSETPPTKDMAFLIWRYKDPLKYDDMWTYVPTLRRTLRMVSSERANPIQGTPKTWDDTWGFDGKIPQFTFKILGEQTVLNLVHEKLSSDTVDTESYPWHPIVHHNEEYEEVPCWVIEVKSKDPRYPSSHKTLWVGKDNYWVTYAETYDKTGNFWKGYYNAFRKKMMKTAEGLEPYAMIAANTMTDFKTSFWVMAVTGANVSFNGDVSPKLFQPGSLGR